MQNKVAREQGRKSQKNKHYTFGIVSIVSAIVFLGLIIYDLYLLAIAANSLFDNDIPISKPLTEYLLPFFAGSFFPLIIGIAGMYKDKRRTLSIIGVVLAISAMILIVAGSVDLLVVLEQHYRFG
jgi:hypothetical protein